MEQGIKIYQSDRAKVLTFKLLKLADVQSKEVHLFFLARCDAMRVFNR